MASATLAITGTVGDDDDRVFCDVAHSGVIVCSRALTIATNGAVSGNVTLSEGVNNLTFTAQDQAGNKTVVAMTITYTPGGGGGSEPAEGSSVWYRKAFANLTQPDLQDMVAGDDDMLDDNGSGRTLIPPASLSGVTIKAHGFGDSNGKCLLFNPDAHDTKIHFSENLVAASYTLIVGGYVLDDTNPDQVFMNVGSAILYANNSGSTGCWAGYGFSTLMSSGQSVLNNQKFVALRVNGDGTASIFVDNVKANFTLGGADNLALTESAIGALGGSDDTQKLNGVIGYVEVLSGYARDATLDSKLTSLRGSYGL